MRAITCTQEDDFITLATDGKGIVISELVLWGFCALPERFFNKLPSQITLSQSALVLMRLAWRTIDIARRFYPAEVVADMCSYVSFFKQNAFQLPLGDQPVLPRYTPDNIRDLALADKQWGGNLTEQQFGDVYPKSYPFITAQYLERRISSKDATTFKYGFSKQSSNSVTNLSPNEYHGSTTCASSDSCLVITSSCLVVSPRYTKRRRPGRKATCVYWVQ